VCAVALAAAVAAPAAAGAKAGHRAPRHGTAAQAVVERPIVFAVRNLNRTSVPCMTDGGAYRVRGTLVGPAQGLGRNGGAATLYLHGLGFGEFFWSFTAVAGYDFAAQMAARGHVSVIIDRLGYGASDHPPGTQSCIGGQADIAHQIVSQLRAGTYTMEGGRPVSFGRVALVGHSVGGEIAQVETWSFRDVDAVGVLSWADQGQSLLATTTFLQAGVTCANGGVSSAGAPGYAPFGATAADFDAAMFHDAAPAVVNAANALRNPDPCGDDNSVVEGIALDHVMLPTVTVPVFLLYGSNDALFPPPAGSLQQAHFVSSHDVSLTQLADTGHAVTLERSAPTLEANLSRWLTARGF
jgi:pimeloyl-ACP methyl ester carboxylesterase